MGALDFLNFTEAHIIQRLNYWRAQRSDYTFVWEWETPNVDEARCIRKFEGSPPYILFGNVGIWGAMAYFTLAKPQPLALTGLGIAAISVGAFGTIYLSTRYVARSCLQCIIDQKDKTSEFYKTTRELLSKHHLNANAYFKRERYKLLRKEEGGTPDDGKP
ncbi:hypothetical protein HK101_009890 [Irineochytrium annulatum]|nr:hypothetical protein HK101_009890 [Irineochytrium annulatum]